MPRGPTRAARRNDRAAETGRGNHTEQQKGGGPHMSYLTKFSLRRTGRREPIPGTAQVSNSAGGHAWGVDDWARLRRFLILGSEGGSFYASQWTLTRENAKTVWACIER